MHRDLAQLTHDPEPAEFLLEREFQFEGVALGGHPGAELAAPRAGRDLPEDEEHDGRDEQHRRRYRDGQRISGEPGVHGSPS